MRILKKIVQYKLAIKKNTIKFSVDVDKLFNKIYKELVAMQNTLQNYFIEIIVKIETSLIKSTFSLVEKQKK